MKALRLRALWVAIVAACLALTACSGFGGSNSSNSAPKDALCPGKKAAKDITVVSFWTVWATKDYLKAAQDFNCDHPDIAVNISINNTIGNDQNGKLLAAVSAHKGPDLVLSFDDVLIGWAARKELEPIDKYVTAPGLKPSEFITEAVQSTQWNGHTYGVPLDWDPDALLWWNKKVFADAGLNPDKPPSTWEEVQADAAKIDSIQGGKIKRLGFIPWAGWPYNYIQLGHQYGADLQDGASVGDAAPRVVADSPGMRKLFTYEAQVAKKYGGGAKINGFLTVKGAEGAAANPLLSGRVGMMLTGDYVYGAATRAFGKAKAQQMLGVTSMPPPPGGKRYLAHSGWAYMVPSGAKHPDQAMEFVKWMEQTDHFGKYVGQVMGFLPARTANLQQSYLTSDPVWKQIIAIQKEAGRGWWLAPSPILNDYSTAFDQAQSAVITLQKSPAAALAAVQKQAQSAFDAAKSKGLYG